MSGYAEVMGRHQLSWDQQFVYDVEYVQKLTFLFDITIFLKTIPKVLNSSQVTGMGNAGKSRLDQVREKQN
jgi:undecaprenyl phosphate N,N'-diacetylbacillosamine 1-phosphate transferase